MVVFRDEDKRGYTLIGNENGKLEILYVIWENMVTWTYYIIAKFPMIGAGFVLQQNF